MMIVVAFCIDCLKHRPTIDLDGTPGCIVCTPRKRRQAAITAPLRKADQQRARKRREDGAKTYQTNLERGHYQKRGPEVHIAKSAP